MFVVNVLNMFCGEAANCVSDTFYQHNLQPAGFGNTMMRLQYYIVICEIFDHGFGTTNLMPAVL